MAEIRIVQCLCGPRRHAIAATLYERSADVGPETAPVKLKEAVDGLLGGGVIHPW